MKYYYWGEINGREFLYKNFIRRDNEPDDDLQADVSSPFLFPLFITAKTQHKEEGVRISEIVAWKTYPLFSSV